jgi:tetratricopeptide (TPR) repeat protein
MEGAQPVHARSTIIENSMAQDSDVGPGRARAEERYYLALEALANGNAQAAIDEFREALAIDPQFLDAMHGLIRALQDAGRLDEAVAAAQELARLDPDDVLAYTALSILYQHKGLVPEAEEAGLKAKLLGWKQQLRAAKP